MEVSTQGLRDAKAFCNTLSSIVIKTPIAKPYQPPETLFEAGR